MHKFVVYIHWVLTNAYTHVAPIKIYITITPKFPHVPSSSLKSECIFPQMIKFKNKTDFLLSKMKEKKKACFTSPFLPPTSLNFVDIFQESHFGLLLAVLRGSLEWWLRFWNQTAWVWIPALSLINSVTFLCTFSASVSSFERWR